VPERRYRYSKLRWRVLVRALDLAGALASAAWRRFRPAPRVDAPARILLVQLDHLGDAILTSPMLPRLRAAYPGARIDVLASASNRAVFEADPAVDRVHVAERNWFARGAGGWALASAVWGLGRRLRRERYELGIDVRGDVLSVLVLALAGIPRRLGWAMGGGGFLLTDVAEWVPGRHEVESRMALLDRLGLAEDGPARVRVHVTDDDRARVARRLRAAWPDRPARPPARALAVGAASRGASRPEATADPPDAESLHAGRFGGPAPLLAVHLGAGTAAKRWPIRSWRALIGRFLDDGWRVVVVGGDAEVGVATGWPPHPRLIDWAGTLAVTETTALLERADLFLGADSGPAHLAAAAGVPSVVLFSGTNRPAQWRPYSRRSLVLRRPVPCQPCHRKTCPLADHPCLAGLGPDRVYRAARRWWARLHRSEAPHGPL
jgi:heptosyltransferase-2